MQNYWLNILIFFPISIGIIIGIFKLNHFIRRGLTVFVNLVQLVIVVLLWLGFDNKMAGYDIKDFQYVFQREWFRIDLVGIGKISTDYFVGIDGLGLVMVVLSVIVFLVVTLCSWNQVYKSQGYFALLLLLNGVIIGCFVSLDLLLFYLFFEVMLLPMFFLIGIWGGSRKEYAAIKFFLYTLLGSIFILVVMIAINMSCIDPIKTSIEMDLIEFSSQYDQTIAKTLKTLLLEKNIPESKFVHTFNLIHLSNKNNLIPASLLDVEFVHNILGYPSRLLMFLLIFIGFAIKLPVVPFHTWLADAHVEAPTAISVVLAGVLLKVGGYGLIRVVSLVFPDGLLYFSSLLGFLGVLSIVYGAMIALASTDFKKIIAYSSISHMGFVLLGIASINVEGMTGAIYQMISHGLISMGLFIIVGILYHQTNDRYILNYSGLAQIMPKYTIFVVIYFFAALGLPGFSSFISEIFVLIGSYGSNLLPSWMMLVATFGLLLNAGYFLWLIQRMFFGNYHVKNQTNKLQDVGVKNRFILTILTIFITLMGVFPNIILNNINTTVITILKMIGNSALDY